MILLFTDHVGSTELLCRLGDQEADELRRAHFTLRRDAIGSTGGREVKNLGDGVMAAFTDPAEALRCAVALEQAVARHDAGSPARRLSPRIGVHAGEPVEEEGDLFGAPVAAASRP